MAQTFKKLTINGGGVNDTFIAPQIAADFSTSKAYSVGDYCTYQGETYRFTAAKTAGAWDVSKVTAVNVADDVGDLKSASNTSVTSIENGSEAMTGGRLYVFKPGYIKTVGVGETADFTPIASATYSHVIIPVTAGDVIHRSIWGGAGYQKASITLDANLVVLSRYANTGHVTSDVVVSNPDAAYVVFNTQNENYSTPRTDYYVVKGNLITDELGAVSDRVSDAERAIYDRLADEVFFTQGSINSSGVNISSSIRLRTALIPVDSLIKAVCGNGGVFGIFGYDEKLSFIASDTSKRTIVTTDTILSAIPGTKFVRFRFGVSGDPDITPDVAPTYGLHCYVSNEYYSPQKEPLTYAVLSKYLNANNELEATLNYRFYLDSDDVVNKIFSIRAKYTGNTPPYFRLYAYSPNGQILAGQPMQFLSSNEFITQDFRLPNDYCITSYQINLVIPTGSKLTVQDCRFLDDNSVIRGDCGVIVEAHRGLDCIFPGDSYDGIVAAGKCGFRSCVTIPKFTSDGVGVCFHNDGYASNPLSDQLSLEDGSPIPGMTETSKISDYTYAELLQWSIGATKDAVFAGCKILTLDDFFGICSQYGMHPVLSIHPSPTTAQWEYIKALTDKWGLTPYLSVKSGNYSDVWRPVINVFGDGVIERFINIYSTTGTYDIIDWINTGKSVAGISETPVDAEFFDASLSGTTYGAAQMAQLEAAVAAGIHTSVVMQASTNTAKMREYVNKGVSEFTNGRFVNNGLIW